ncbi:MFS transporter [Paralcaligenes ureilyticus]|uniref:Sugar phosphate permease n=1 Tax=Paralcaligenes ureilyticus TaxID=627131 RepID=A0A4R3M2E6_9BURK|nr:MFS transporter [Paralcaligenes ureilyticus]TCT07290.1 sugar phosphate permease [Paralcaligenes ureilyticus]
MRRVFPAWAVPVIAILVLQTTTSFLTRLIPIAFPAMMEPLGWDGSWIGYLTAATTIGALFILIVGTTLIRQIGGIRAVQLGLLIGAASVVLFFFPSLILALIASFMIGLSYGTASPAGSEVLQRFSPPESRNLVFSIKQAGVPLGGVIAGLAIPPLIDIAGWRIALLVAALLVVVTTCLTWRLHGRVDEPAARAKTYTWPNRHTIRNLGIPLKALARGPGLPKLATVGFLLATTQSCWFTFMVIYLVDDLHYSLSLAGVVFAIMQAAGVAGRIALGWFADRIGSAPLTLTITAVGSALTTLLLGFSTEAWPLWAMILLSAAAGATAASWNGVQIAEVARRSPPELVGETAAGSSIVVYLANMVAPVAFAAFVAITGRFDHAFVAIAVFSLLSIVFLIGLDGKEIKVGENA